MRLTAFAAILLLAGAAQAQTPLTGTTGPLASSPPVTAAPTPRTVRPRAPATTAAAPASTGTEVAAPVATGTTARPHTGRSLHDRFEASNVTHDGHLTLEQARSHMPSVARDFSAIDTDRKGYVTEDQIRAYRKAKRAASRAAKRAAAAVPN